ncbi:unnamed protein product [Amoebophrya sp. A120]|nr:unnamed protein product [Amoebophrya sp. A120]|eukprot:GSA120T00011206001.1
MTKMISKQLHNYAQPLRRQHSRNLLSAVVFWAIFHLLLQPQQFSSAQQDLHKGTTIMQKSISKKIDTSLIFRATPKPELSEALDRSVMYLLKVLQILFFHGSGLVGEWAPDETTGVSHFQARYNIEDERENGNACSGGADAGGTCTTRDSARTEEHTTTTVDLSYNGPQKDDPKLQIKAHQNTTSEEKKKNKTRSDDKVELQSSSSAGVQQEEKKDEQILSKTRKSYPAEYIRFCWLGIGDSSSVLLQRFMMIFPQFIYVLIDTDFDLDFLQYLQLGFPNAKIEVNYEDPMAAHQSYASGSSADESKTERQKRFEEEDRKANGIKPHPDVRELAFVDENGRIADRIGPEDNLSYRLDKAKESPTEDVDSKEDQNNPFTTSTAPSSPLGSKCDVLAFGRDTPKFTFKKLQKWAKDPTVILWLTDGCGDGDSLTDEIKLSEGQITLEEQKKQKVKLKQQCQFTYSQWRSSLCGDPEDLINNMQASTSAMQAVLDSKYGSYGPCYKHKRNDYTKEEGFETQSPVCVCALMPELVHDFYFEKANCAEFSNPKGLPPGKRILGRNTENWYDPKKDYFLGFGQWNQDWFLFHNFFRNQIFPTVVDKKTLKTRQDLVHKLFAYKSSDGIYIDIGAMGAFELSNTAVFDQCFNWKGICVEPNPAQHYILEQYRTCVVEKRAVGRKRELQNFSLDYTGSVGHLKGRSAGETEELFWTKLEGGQDGGGEAARFLQSTFTTEVITLEDLLLENGASEKHEIDFISIDVEGGEYEILVDFPFEKFPNINVFLIEVDAKNVFKMDILMSLGKYVKVAQLGKDQVYVSRRFSQKLAGEYFRSFVDEENEEKIVNMKRINPFELAFPPYINIEPYNDTFDVFQRRFLDPDFGG